MLFFINVLVLVVVIGVGILILTRYLEGACLFFPNRHILVTPPLLDFPGWEDVYFKTSDGVQLNAWLFKNPRGPSTLFWAHGNAGNIADRLLKLKFFYDLGLNVFIFDYRGYGKSEGSPSEEGVYKDACAAYDYLASRGDIDMHHLIFYGASLGGVVVIDLATKRNYALLIVESSITSARQMAQLYYPFLPSFFLSLRLDAIAKVRNLKGPKLFIHSPEDDIVPFWMGRRLFEEAPAPKEFLSISGGHNDGALAHDPQAVKEFTWFLRKQGLIA